MGPPAARPAARGPTAAAAAAGQPAQLKIKPKAPGRRSLQEREQADREERARAAARANAEANQAGNNGGAGGTAGRGRAAAAAASRARGFFRGGRGGASGGPAQFTRGWSGGVGGRGGGRGYGMPPPERQGEGMASGPFGAGSVLTAGVSFSSSYPPFSMFFFMLAPAPFIIPFPFLYFLF